MQTTATAASAAPSTARLGGRRKPKRSERSAPPTTSTASPSPAHHSDANRSQPLPPITYTNVVAAIAAPTTGAAATAAPRKTDRCRFRRRSTRPTSQSRSVAPTSGSARFARTSPAVPPTLVPRPRSSATSAVAAAARTTGHRRRRTRTSVASVTPAGGKKEAPWPGALNHFQAKAYPSAYAAATRAKRMTSPARSARRGSSLVLQRWAITLRDPTVAGAEERPRARLTPRARRPAWDTYGGWRRGR